MHPLAQFRVNCVNRCGDMTVFDCSKWQHSAILDFSLPVRYVEPICVTKPNFVPIGRTVAETWTFYSIFYDGGVRHFGFLKVRNFTHRSDREGQYASPCQILCRSVELLRRYGQFSISQDGGRPPSWICFTCIWITHEEHLLVFVTVQNLVGIDAVVLMICQF